MKSFFKFFAERHLLANLVTVLVLFLGFMTLTRIQRDTFPSVDFGEVIVQTLYPGASPEDVELKVTNKIEDELREVTGIRDFTSYSLENVSIIDILLDPDEKDAERVKRDIRDAVNRVVDLPAEVEEKPLVTELKTTIFPILEIGLAGDLPYRELRELARRFEKKLKQVPGVTRVERYGYREREVRIAADPDRLHEYEIPLRALVGAIQARNIRATGGSFESYTSEKNIVTLAQFRDPAEVRDVVVRATFEGPLVTLGDVAEVRDDFEQEKVASRVNGRNAISFLAFKSETADIIRTAEAIQRLVDKEKPGLPPDVEFVFSNDASRYVRNQFSIVLSNGAIGFVLVLILLALFLTPRAALWVASGIPFAVLGTIFCLPAFGVYLDSVTMTALVLVLGIIVDDAIIMAESIYDAFEKGADPVTAAVQGALRVYLPVLGMVITTLLAFAPMFFMPGMMGKFVFVIPLTVSLALVWSMAESFTVLPAHLARGLQRRGDAIRSSRKETWFHGLRDRYSRITWRLLPLRYLWVLLFFAVLGGSLVYAYRYMDFVLFPSRAAEMVYVRMKLPVGSSLQATSDRAAEFEAMLEERGGSDLASYTARIGINDPLIASEMENMAVVSINLTPFAQRRRTADEIVEELRAGAASIEGIEDIWFEIDSGGPPVGRPITLRLVGTDDALRKRAAGEVASFLATLPGVKDIDRDDKEGKLQIELGLDYAKLARLGLSVADVAQTVRIAYDGEVATSVRYGEEDVNFRVQFREDARRDEEVLRELMVPNAEGRLIPLRQFADLRIGPGPENFYHFKGERAVTVTADVTKGLTTPLEAVRRVQERFDMDRDFPGLRLVVGGEGDETQKSVNDLIKTFSLAVVGIYFLLVLLFNSFVQPLLVVIAIPFGIIGVILAFAIHGESFGFLAMMGLIGLAGVVVNDSLVLVSHLNDLRQANPEKDMRQIVADGTGDRLRAILMTSLTTVAGLLPLAYGLGGVDPYMSPMALALGWGLALATPLNLVLVPCLYLIFHDVGRLGRKLLRLA